jgi:hypothetical protein
MLVFCEECHIEPGGKDEGPGSVSCAGGVLVSTAEYEAQAGQITICGSRLDLQAGKQGESVVLRRKPSADDQGECQITAKRIIFDISTKHVTVSGVEVELSDLPEPLPMPSSYGLE